MSAPDSWLGAEPILVARLQAVLGESVHVLTARTLAVVEESGQPTPAVHVLYHRDAEVASGGAGAVTTVKQDWLAVVCVDNQANLKQGAEAAADAGRLAMQVHAALVTGDWRPGGGLHPFEPVSSPFTTTYSAGRFYLPLAFRTRFQLR